jgi:phage tail-like protein
VSTGPDGQERPNGSGLLVASLEGSVVQKIPITPGALTIGRLPDNRLVLPHPTVSRHHAEVRVDEGQPTLVDVGSSSGTFLGSVRLLPNQPIILDAAVRIKIGPYLLTFEPSPAMPQLAAIAVPHAAVPLSARLGPTRELDELPPIPGRPTWPAPLPVNGKSSYVGRLPCIFEDDDFLGRMLLIFEGVWEPLEQRQDHLPLYFDPATCPAIMLPWLAGWLNLELDPHWPEERRRRLLKEAMELYRWRGTAYGLTRVLEVCTGLSARVTEDPATPWVFRVAVRIPPGSGVAPDFIEALVKAHKPAHVGYVLEIAS